MEQTLPLRKAALGAASLASLLGLAACAGGGRLAEAPSAAPVSPQRAASLHSSGYDAPAFDAARTNETASAVIVPAAYEAPVKDAPTPMSPYFTPEAPSSVSAEAAVPAPTPRAYAATPRAPLPDLDAIIVTDERAPVRTAQVYEGETRSVLPERAAPRAPAPAPAPATNAPAAPASRADAAPASSASSALHLASYRRADQAEAGWAVLTRDHGPVLAGLSPARTRIDVPGQGTFVRLIAGPLDPGQAQTACAALERQGAYCAVTDWTTDRF